MNNSSSPKKSKGKVLISIGLLLIAAALILTFYNLWDANRAAKESQKVRQQIGISVEDVESAEQQDVSNQMELPDYLRFPDMEMPVENIDGYYYVGILEIPSQELSLPVMSDWNYAQLKVSPCRYAGSVYKDDMVIAAHNYRSHFGKLKNLALGDEVYFIDMDGNVFSFQVADIEVLEPTDIEEMKNSGYDLSLFTCTYGGQARLTIRCDRIE